MDGIIRLHAGRIVGTAGDSVLAEFASPTLTRAPSCSPGLYRVLPAAGAVIDCGGTTAPRAKGDRA